MFDSTIELFKQYIDKMIVERSDTFNEDLAVEACKRLEQLNYLHKAIADKELKYAELQQKQYGDLSSLQDRVRQAGGKLRISVSDEIRAEMKALIFEIEMNTECFYYFTGRMRTIIKHSSAPLPGLGSFECENARNNRNHLLEHPESRDSRVFIQSFGTGGPSGPELKAQRPAGQEDIFPDKGLYANASEIKENLEKLLKKILK